MMKLLILQIISIHHKTECLKSEAPRPALMTLQETSCGLSDKALFPDVPALSGWLALKSSRVKLLNG